jgi:uroporphyrinogen decarboxylase-like protein
MDYRTRIIKTLRGEPTDRLPFVETAKFDMVRAHSDWDDHLGEGEDPRSLFGFDNAGVPAGYESVPIDWYAVPRFPHREIPSNDGYVRSFDHRWGSVKKSLPADPARPWAEYTRIFEGHFVSTRADWLEAKERFQVSADDRLPTQWRQWCEHSKTAGHPIVLELADPITWAWNLLGPGGQTGLLISIYDRSDLIREMVDHLSEWSRICAEKVCRDARVDMVMIGSDCLSIVGPTVVREFAIGAYETVISTLRSCGVDLICLHGRGDLRPLVEMFRAIGANGFAYVVEIGDADYFPELVDQHGDDLFSIGCLDGRVLLREDKDIEREVAHKIDMARRYRMLPCLQAPRILPEVRWEKYVRYATCLREAVFCSVRPE